MSSMGKNSLANFKFFKFLNYNYNKLRKHLPLKGGKKIFLFWYNKK